LGELVKCKFLNHTHKPKIPVELDISGVLTGFQRHWPDTLVGHVWPPAWTCPSLFLILGYPNLFGF
jgi:hypothetical protein